MHPFPGGYPKFIKIRQWSPGCYLDLRHLKVEILWSFFSLCSASFLFKRVNIIICTYVLVCDRICMYTHIVIKSHGCGNLLCFQVILPPSLKNQENQLRFWSSAAKRETQETANLSPREKCRSRLDGFVRSTSFKALPDVTCFVDSHSRMKNQPRVWGRVVWIAGIPENEMDCYLRKSLRKSESQANKYSLAGKDMHLFRGGIFRLKIFWWGDLPCVFEMCRIIGGIYSWKIHLAGSIISLKQWWDFFCLEDDWPETANNLDGRRTFGFD